MSRQVDTKKCNLGHDHVVQERIRCEACGGLIAAIEPRTVEWFGKGVYSEIQQYLPLGEIPREPITLIYSPRLASTVFENHFCCISHLMLWLRNLPEGYLPSDRIQIVGTVHAFAQIPVQEIPQTD